MANLICRNPANGEILKELPATPIAELPALFERARAAQLKWAAVPVRKRAAHLLQMRETLLNHLDETILLISQENGKPRFEAMSHDLIPSLDMLTYFAKRAPVLLRDHPIPMEVMKHRKSYLNYWPLGVVAIISPWNFPFMIPFSEILLAVAAGNAVVFKPSEATPQIGLKIQQICDEAGLPPNLVQTVIGDGAAGAAIIEQKPAKIFFTGSVATGKKIMAAAAKHLIPVNLELGGKNPIIILPDADVEYATSIALWGSFANSGQVCAATSRILVHESLAEKFVARFKEKVLQLRQGPTIAFDNDLGAITYQNQKAIYEEHIADARAKGATILTGGELSENRNFLKPTVIMHSSVEDLKAYQEETFGPVVTISTFKTPAEAIEKANRTRYGLAATVVTKNISFGEEIAKQLEAGTVMINEVLFTAGLAEAPWGGVKESGFGRTHSDLGLMEFVHTRYINKPRSRLFIFKSPWWFPYSADQFTAFRYFAELYRRHWSDKIKAFPHFLTNLIGFLKKERRL